MKNLKLLIIPAFLALTACCQPPSRPGPSSGTVSWDEMKKVIQNGQIKSVAQTHSLRVDLYTVDGRHYQATEPAIDEIFKFLRETGKTPREMMTE